MTPTPQIDAALLIRWAAMALNPVERSALEFWLAEATDREAARHIGVTRGGVYMARQSGFKKMRRRLAQLGIRGIEDLL